MARTLLSIVCAGFTVAVLACTEGPTVDQADPGGTGPELAPPSSSQVPLEITLAPGTDLIPDGKGSYRDGVCGVFAKWTDSDAGASLNFVPGSSVPKSQIAACAGIAPRTISLALRVKHLNDDPHEDVTDGPGSGTFAMNQFAMAVGGGTKINAPPACFLVSRTGKVSGRGLRFDADNYVGSDDLIREDQGNGLWRFYSPPDALAWCEDNSGISLWHVVVDFTAQKF
ncbi:MAG TPA: hypothetical protein VF862_05715 [Gemmatimonadales bacterium]